MRFCQNPSVTSWDFPCKFDTKGLRANTSSQSECDGLSQDCVYLLRLRMMRHAHSLTAPAMEKCVERAFFGFGDGTEWPSSLGGGGSPHAGLGG